MPAQHRPEPLASDEAAVPTSDPTAASAFVASHQQQVLPTHAQQQAPPSPMTVGRDRHHHHHHRHTDHDAGADEEPGREAAVVPKTEETDEMSPEGPLGTGAHDLGDAGQAEPSRRGGGGGAAPPPVGPAADAEDGDGEEEAEEELLEDAAKAADDIAIVLRR